MSIENSSGSFGWDVLLRGMCQNIFADAGLPFDIIEDDCTINLRYLYSSVFGNSVHVRKLEDVFSIAENMSFTNLLFAVRKRAPYHFKSTLVLPQGHSSKLKSTASWRRYLEMSNLSSRVLRFCGSVTNCHKTVGFSKCYNISYRFNLRKCLFFLKTTSSTYIMLIHLISPIISTRQTHSLKSIKTPIRAINIIARRSRWVSYCNI